MRDDSDHVLGRGYRGARVAFDRASRSYDAAAGLQARVRTSLLERATSEALRPEVVLDLGAGTGQGARELKRCYPHATIIALDFAHGMLREADRHCSGLSPFTRVCADALRLPLKDASIDVVFTSLMLQWCDPLSAAFGEICRVLKPGGFLRFSTLGPDTLHELRAAWSAADAFNHVNRFTDAQTVRGALMRAGLANPAVDVERIKLAFPDAFAVMRNLKEIGAHHVAVGRSRGLMGKARLQRMADAYESFRQNGEIPVTYEVIFGAACRLGPT